MAKLVECVPNFSEGNNKEVRERTEGLRGGQCRGADGWAAPAEGLCRQHLLSDSALPPLKCCALFPAWLMLKMPKGGPCSLLAPW